MPVIETLAYVPIDMDKFIDFVIDGKKENGVHVTVGGQIATGVISWLQGRGVKEAHFFNSPAGDPMQLFVATIQKPETYERPWMKEIACFAEYVKTDGLIGTITNFAPIGSLFASVASNPILDQKFAMGALRVETIRESIRRGEPAFPIAEEELLATLRGEKGTDPQALFSEVKKSFGFSL